MHQHIKIKRPPKWSQKLMGGIQHKRQRPFVNGKQVCTLVKLNSGTTLRWTGITIVISNAAEQWRVIITRMIKHMIKYVLMTNRTADMDPVINMNGVSWNIKTRYWVLKHMAMICQDLPVRLPNTITGLKIMDGSKIEWSVDEHILVKHMNVLLGNYQVILNSIRPRWARRLDQMTLMRLIWMK